MTARYIVGDVLQVLETVPEASVDLVLTSPPFLALRSYLPADSHRDAMRHGLGRPADDIVSNSSGAPPLDWWHMPTQPYSGAHYATWPEALLRIPILSMCPQQVCTTCGEPARRIVDAAGWTDCEHGTWRPGVVLDPFAGTGTTLAAAVGHGRTAIGIDLDARNVALARERVGMWLTVRHAEEAMS